MWIWVSRVEVYIYERGWGADSKMRGMLREAVKEVSRDAPGRRRGGDAGGTVWVELSFGS